MGFVSIEMVLDACTRGDRASVENDEGAWDCIALLFIALFVFSFFCIVIAALFIFSNRINSKSEKNYWHGAMFIPNYRDVPGSLALTPLPSPRPGTTYRLRRDVGNRF